MVNQSKIYGRDCRMGLNNEVLKIIKKSRETPREVVEVLPEITVKYHPPQMCAGLYHVRFSYDEKILDAFIQPEGYLRGAAYKGTTDVIGFREAYGIINTKLESLLESGLSENP